MKLNDERLSFLSNNNVFNRRNFALGLFSGALCGASFLLLSTQLFGWGKQTNSGATGASDNIDTEIKIASAYGFSPLASPSSNVKAMREALKGGGTIIVDEPGVYNVNGSMIIDDDTKIVFHPGVSIKKVNSEHSSPRYTFINRGAFSKTWNKNITIMGLHLTCNGVGNGSDDTETIYGLRGQLAFHYVENLHISNFYLDDAEASSYIIHICTFKNIKIEKSYFEGWKDAIHLGRGSGYVIRDCMFKTYDDPIALNAHDYSTGQPELGWITDGLVEHCYDLPDPSRGTTGYFARILAGAWLDWFSGMEVQQSDTVIYNGKMYRVFNKPDGTTYRSISPPSHDVGIEEIDGINWKMVQSTDIVRSVGVRNIKFKDIFLLKDRPTGFSIHFDNDKHSRSYYPGSEIPMQDGIIFENLHTKANIPSLIKALTPVREISLVNCDLNKTTIFFNVLPTDGMTYPEAIVTFYGTKFNGEGRSRLIHVQEGRSINLRIEESQIAHQSYSATFSGDIKILTKDI